MSLRNIVARLFVALSLGALPAANAFAFRVDYGDQTICTEFYECTDYCYINSRGQETCETTCDTVEFCYGGLPGEIDDSDVVCDFNDPEFFRCIGVIQ